MVNFGPAKAVTLRMLSAVVCVGKAVEGGDDVVILGTLAIGALA
jgi:hypothetical protein